MERRAPRQMTRHARKKGGATFAYGAPARVAGSARPGRSGTSGEGNTFAEERGGGEGHRRPTDPDLDVSPTACRIQEGQQRRVERALRL
eukprot:scaffold6544_cov140-Isochrysis_galbana.AAC.2